MAETETDPAVEEGEAPRTEPRKVPSFGRLTVPAGGPDVSVGRDRFRIAVLGDFSARASRGVLESGSALGARKPLRLDVDTIDDVIGRFRTQLTLPIGPEGAAVEIELGSLDDLHPDELYENVEVFSELQNLRRQLRSGRADQAMKALQGWGAEFGALKGAGRGRARGAEVPADMRLDDFSRLIGSTAHVARATSDVQELIQRVVGPYVVKAPDPQVEAMVAAVDDALSGTMRSLLHHPDFQAVESAWRSLDLLARRIETGGGLEIVVYDVAAEELAADLSATDELSETGLFEMLCEKPGLDAGQGPLAVIVGLYQFEETPPHAELLGRMAQIAAYADAPFIASISPRFLETKEEDLHPLVRSSWDELRALPEAPYVALASPRFLLRQPYGRMSDPIDPFDFEEFTLREGLKGMLWANPAVLAAVLIGASWKKGGGKVALGSVMTLDDIPFHYMKDQHGDQVALPCTERLLTERAATVTALRGFMPVLSVAGRNEVRLGSFRAVNGAEMHGPWSDAGVGGPAAMRRRAEERVKVELAANAEAARKAEAAKAAAAPAAARPAPPPIPPEEMVVPTQVPQNLPEPDEETEDEDLTALLAGLDEPDETADEEMGDDDLDALLAGLDDLGGDEDADLGDLDAGGEDDDLDALLAQFGDDEDDSGGDAEMDAELEALLKDL